MGAPLVQGQLLASQFYEALKRKLRATSDLGIVERSVVVAVAHQCRRAATKSINPSVILASFEAPLRYCSLVGRWHRTRAGGDTSAHRRRDVTIALVLTFSLRALYYADSGEALILGEQMRENN
jgi:hypothetical protein